MNVKRWNVVFRALVNPNRLLIVKMLSDEGKMTVAEIAEKFEISVTATSNHLVLLKNLDVLNARGTEGHVLYWVNTDLPKDYKKAIDIALRS